jgi:hypothetical protein
MATERQKGARGAPRTELVAVRFDPELKYMMELAARVQRRSVANYVEWAVEESLKNVEIHLFGIDDGEPTMLSDRQVRSDLWDPLEPDRFCNLAYIAPNLLTHDEQKLWKFIKEVVSILYPSSNGFLMEVKVDQHLEAMELVRKSWEFLKNSAYEGMHASTAVELINQVKDD